MTEEGLLTIITPCHNSAPYVGRLLDSILLQDYPAVEVIAVDDDSSDSTAEILAGYIPSFQSRGYVLKVLRQPRQGQSGAINNALKNGEGGISRVARQR